MVRTVVGIVAGMAVVGVVVTLLQQVSSAMHPLPPGLDPMNPEDAAAFAEHMAGMPASAWLIALLSEVLGAGAGAFVAGLIARDALRVASGVVVGLATIASVMNWLAFPHPIWFIVAQLVLYPAALMLVWAVLSERSSDGTAGAGASMVVALVLGSTFAVAAPAPALAQSHDDLIAQAVLPLPEDLRADAGVFRYDASTGQRQVLRDGGNHVECSPRGDTGFTLCYPKSTAAWRDMRARLSAEGLSQDAVDERLRAAEANGRVEPPRVGSMVYRLYDEGDRIQLLWLILVPDQTAADLAMPMGSQRDASLAGHGTPWLMNEGTAGAHLMMPINQTDRSNAGTPEPLLDPSTITDPVQQATLPLPDDLKDKATVSTFDPETGLWTLHQRGSSTIECRPHDPETGFTRCYHESVWARRDMSARLAAQGHSEDEIAEAMAEAHADGTLGATAMASLGYRLYQEDDRIRLLWILSVPSATAAELGMPTGSQRDNSLAGRGTPWMMNQGTAGAHLMIPINGTALSNR